MQTNENNDATSVSSEIRPDTKHLREIFDWRIYLATLSARAMRGKLPEACSQAYKVDLFPQKYTGKSCLRHAKANTITGDNTSLAHLFLSFDWKLFSHARLITYTTT